jgi:hypothetical protein
MTNTPTASAASSTPATRDSRGRNSELAALATTIRITVDSATPSGRTIAPNSTTLPSTTTSGRSRKRGIASPRTRSARRAIVTPSTISRMPRMRGK